MVWHDFWADNIYDLEHPNYKDGTISRLKKAILSVDVKNRGDSGVL